MIPSTRRLSGIEGLANLLKKSGLDFDDKNLADALWLALQITPEDALGSEAEVDEDDERTHSTSVRERQKSQSRQIDHQQTISLNLGSHQRRQVESTYQKSSARFQTPAAPALPDTLSLGRALRPLMRKVNSNRLSLLDEEATAEQTAERKVCIPVLKPAQERWLEVAMVVEESSSTLLWKEIIDDFQRMLEHQGAFRDVRTWSLITNQAGEPELYSKRYIRHEKQRVRSPRELLDPGGRRLIILISDCISPLWQSGQIFELLKVWYQDCPFTLLQMLPEKLWDRSVLGHGFPAKLSALAPVMSNNQFWSEGLPLWQDINLERSLKIPVITLDPEVVSKWSRVMAGVGNTRTAGRVFDEVALDDLPAELSAEETSDLTAEALVKRFRKTASPLARELAGLMALVPVSPPIIYLIQKTSLPESRQVHVAEIFMSGLLKPLEGEVGPSGTPTQFQFVEGVREELRKSVSKSDRETVLDEISQYIARKAGISIRNFTALLSLPTDKLGYEAEEIEEFARLARSVLREMGGFYAVLADSLGHEPIPAPLRLELPPDWPLIQRCQFETATVEVLGTQTVLEPFEFETATLRVLEGEQGREIEIVKEQRQGYQWVEVLDQDIVLEMVQVSAGEFQMGAPRGEQGRSSDEGPQHKVKVESFLMGKYPVTQAQWRFVAGLPQKQRELNPDPARFKGDHRPVERVSWYDAVEFCERLSQFIGREYRLPSEAEWEYACRAGTTTPFHFGETITTDLANFNGNRTYGQGAKGVYREETTEVGSFPANEFGLYDMHGNVWEWCLDYWHENYEGAPEDGQPWLENGDNSRRMLRGGSWNDDPKYCRSAFRYWYDPDYQYDDIGFRVVCSPPRTP